MQRLLDDWILSDSGVDVTVAQNSAVFLPFPTKEYTKSGFYESIGPFAPLLFTIGLLYPVSSTIRSVVLEKELRQKELMKMMVRSAFIYFHHSCQNCSYKPTLTASPTVGNRMRHRLVLVCFILFVLYSPSGTDGNLHQVAVLQQ